eukprot:15367004-Ditylum_brightwellii.AAC.1
MEKYPNLYCQKKEVQLCSSYHVSANLYSQPSIERSWYVTTRLSVDQYHVGGIAVDTKDHAAGMEMDNDIR